MSSYRVTYRLCNGDVHEDCHPHLLAGTPIQNLTPIRPPNNYRGQRHITGLYFSPSTGRHHPFESRLEQSALIRVDFELHPRAIATQPFALLYSSEGGKYRGHIPDILLDRRDDRPLVIDVKPRAFVQQNASAFEALQEACAEIGWEYAIWTEPNPIYAHNLSFLVGYHRQIPGATPLAQALLTRLKTGPLPLHLLVADLGPPCLTRGTLFHLLWTRQILADLSQRLTDVTLLQVGTA